MTTRGPRVQGSKGPGSRDKGPAPVEFVLISGFG